MQQTSPQQSPIQQFCYQATCLKGHRVKRICISSSSCKGNNIYLCGRSDDKCECHFQHRNCPTIAFDSFLDKFMNYKKVLSEQMSTYIERFEKIYSHFQKKIIKEVQIFKAYYESILFGEIKSSIQQKVDSKKFNTISSFEVNQFLNSIELYSQEINCGKLSINEAKQIDKRMIDFFQFVQSLYKQKISRRIRPNSQQKTRSLSSASLQKSFQTLESSSHLRKSSMIERSNPSKVQIFNSNYSMMLEKKKPLNIQEIKFDQTNLLVKPPKINLEYPKAISSKIIDNCSLINHFIGRKVKSYELDFRASENHFQVTKFYSTLTNLQPLKQKLLKSKQLGSLFLVKTQFNNVFGAFTQVPFISAIKSKQSKLSQSESQNQLNQNPEKTKIKGKRKFCNDIRSSTFLFSINLQEKYALTNPQKALYVGSRSVGFGNSDLRIKNKSNNIRENVCRIGDSFKAQGSCGHISVDYEAKSMKMIGSRYGKKFKVSEWQYFTVIFDQKH